MSRDLAGVSEKDNYAEFVNTTLKHLGDGLALDGTERKTAIGTALSRWPREAPIATRPRA